MTIATLGVEIKTGEAAAQLLALGGALRGAASGVAKLGKEVAANAGAIEKALKGLSTHGFAGMSTALNTETRRVGEGMRQMEREVLAAATKTGKSSGKSLAAGVSDGADEGAAYVHRVMLRSAEMTGKLQLAESAKTLRAKVTAANAQHTEALAMNRVYNSKLSEQDRVQQLRDIAIRNMGADALKTQHTEALAMNRVYNSKLSEQNRVQQLRDIAIRNMGADALKTQHTEALSMNRAFNTRRLYAERELYRDINVAHAEGIRQKRIMEDREYKDWQRRVVVVPRAGAGAGVAADASGAGVAGVAALTNEKRKLKEARDRDRDATNSWTAAQRNAHDAARGLSGALGGLWMTYGQLMPLMAGFAVASSLKGGLTASKDFAYQMAFVGSVTGDTAAQLDKVSVSLVKLAQSSMFKPLELAGGMRILAQAGMSTVEAMSALPTVMALAVMGETDLAVAAETTTGIMHAFGLELTDVARIGDVIAKSAAISTTSVARMAESMKQASTVAQQYDLSLSTVSAALVALAERNITGSAAGTAFRNMMNDLSNPTDKAQRALDKMGVSLYDQQGNTKNLTTVMDEMRTSLAGYDKQSRNLLTGAIFSERGNKPAQAILAKTGAEWKAMVGEVDNANGFLTKSMARLQDTVEGRFKNMTANAQAALLAVSEGSEGPLKALAGALTDAFTSPQLIAGIRTLAHGVLGLTRFVVDHVAVLGSIVGTYLVWKVAAAALLVIATGYVKLAAAVTVLNGVLGFLKTQWAGVTITTLASVGATTAATAATTAQAGATVVATTATRALWLAISAHPIGALLTAVGLLAVAYLTLRDNTNGAAKAAADAKRQADASIDLTRQEATAVWDLVHAKEREMGLRAAKGVEEQATRAAAVRKLSDEIARLEADKLTVTASKMMTPREGRGPIAASAVPSGGFSEETKVRASRLLAAREQLRVETGWHAYLKAGNEALATRTEQQEAAVKGLEKWRATMGLGSGTKRVTAEDLKPPGGDKVKSTAPLSVVNYDAAIKQYSVYLAEIDKKEQDALTRSKAFNDAGMTSEVTYLAERKAIRDRADSDALTKLEAYKSAQMIAESEANAEKRAQIAEGRKLGLISGIVTNLKGDETTLNKITSATNRATDARAKYDQAVAEDAARSAQRTQAAVLDELALRKAKFGDIDDDIRKGQEAIAALAAENGATRDLTQTLRDKATVSIEGSIRSAEASLVSAKVEELAGNYTKAHVAELEKKLNVLRKIQGDYKAEQGVGEALKNDPMQGIKEGAAKYLESVDKMGTATSKIVGNAFKGMEDALTNFVMTGKLDFKSLANSIIADMVRMAIQQTITGPLARMALGAIGGMFGVPAVVNAQGNVFTGGTGLSAYTNRVVTSPTAFAFAKGGVPGLGVMGEKMGSPGEAIMPLSRMRGGDLGVKVSGGGDGDGDVNTSIVINVSSDGNAAVTREGASQMGQQIEAAVMKVIFREKRQGGILSGAN